MCNSGYQAGDEAKTEFGIYSFKKDVIIRYIKKSKPLNERDKKFYDKDKEHTDLRDKILKRKNSMFNKTNKKEYKNGNVDVNIF